MRKLARIVDFLTLRDRSSRLGPNMVLFRSYLRRGTAILGVCGWLLLVSDLCVDASAEHSPAEIASVAPQEAGHSHGEHAAIHAECLSDGSWSIDRNAGAVRVVPDALLEQGTIVQDRSVLNCWPVPRSSSAATARSAPPLFLLHSALLI